MFLFFRNKCKLQLVSVTALKQVIYSRFFSTDLSLLAQNLKQLFAKLVGKLYYLLDLKQQDAERLAVWSLSLIGLSFGTAIRDELVK
jgi:hypothetical protein